MKLLNHLLVAVAGLLSLIYLLNPGAGVIDLIPDNLPILGNLDEAAAAALLISCLAYFGLDITALFRKARAESDANASDTDSIEVEVVRD